MTVITVYLNPDPSDIGAPWVAAVEGVQGQPPPARGRSGHEAVRNLMNMIETKGLNWDGSPPSS